LFLFVGVFQTCQGMSCAVGDPCQLNTAYSTARGYGCIQRGPDNVLCRCPNGESESNKPCRLCERPSAIQNACNTGNPRLIRCLEQPVDYGLSYICLCRDSSDNAVATTSWDCDLSVTVTSTTTTSTSVVVGGLECANGGVLVNANCNCPSGFEGALCERRNETNLCDRITCKNAGVKTIRPVNGQYQCVCLCRSGTSGDFCELNATGTPSTCATAGCLNGADCRQVTIATTTHAYCECVAGFKGSKCETRYFACPSAGFFTDLEMFEHGKYFECVVSGGTLRAIRRSCAKGLRYNMNLHRCTY